MFRRPILFAAGAAFVAGCSDPVADAREAFAARHARTLDDYEARFARRLEQALAGGPPQVALSHCRREASRLVVELVAEVGEPSGEDADDPKVTSFVRAGIEEARKQLAWFDGEIRGDLETNTAVGGQPFSVGLQRVLRVGESCMVCHGAGADAEVVTAFRARYPKTEVLGLEPGEPIGLLTISGRL